MRLFHGSTVTVKRPNIQKGRKATDFGKGFYTTTNFEDVYKRQLPSFGLGKGECASLKVYRFRSLIITIQDVYKRQCHRYTVVFLLFFPSPMFHKATMYLNTITWYSYPAKIYTTWKNIYNTCLLYTSRCV